MLAIFLRPPRRGNGSIAVGGRIDRYLAGDYEVLVAEYLRDLLRNHRRQVHFVDIQGSANALRERTLRKILDNRDWSRAVRALSSNGMGDLDHPQVQAELLAKHPQERDHWPPGGESTAARQDTEKESFMAKERGDYRQDARMNNRSHVSGTPLSGGG